MEYPYIALLWSPDHELWSLQATRLLARLQHSRSEWHQVIARRGLTVFTREAPQTGTRPGCLKSYTLAEQRGLILGALFRQGHASEMSPIEVAGDQSLAKACLSSRGAHLTTHYWGAYVAFLCDPATGNWSILRDCSGMLPCYYTSVDDITIAFSDIRDVLIPPDGHTDAQLIPFEVNWHYIAGFLAASQMQIRETGIKRVYELLAGESLQFSAGQRSVDSLWDPALIAQRGRCLDLEETCRVVRDTTIYCVDAWAGTHHSILHSLSGGFDSSLVLSLIARTAKHPKVVCLNRFASGPAEDERRYARMVAEAARVKLEELPWTGGQSLRESCSKSARTAKPTIPQVFAGMHAQIYDNLAASEKADVMWTGQGGDHLFMAVVTAMGIADCRIHRRPGAELKAAFRDASKLTGKSYFHVARAAKAATRTGSFLSAAEMAPRTVFLAADALPEDLATYVRNPWVEASTSLPPGKRLQVIYLAEVLNRHRPYYGVQRLQEFHPLLSQPLIELCLQIPTYLLLTGGKTRGLARKAFQADLPAAVLQRERKGQTTHHTLGVLRENSTFLTEVLLNGRLMSERLLSRDAVGSCLTPDAPIPLSTMFPMMACLAAEVWLESWRDLAAVTHTAGQRNSLPSPSPPAINRDRQAYPPQLRS